MLNGKHDHLVAEELAQRLHQERNEAALSLAQLEERAQGDGITMAAESMRGLRPNFTNGQERIFNFAQEWQTQSIS